MGNTTSSSNRTVFSPSYDPKHEKHHRRQVIKPKRSKSAFSALTLGCTSASAYPESLPSQDSTLGDREEKLSFDPPPLYAYSTNDLLEDDTATEYKTFLKTYPGYQSTWILDALRRSDFARLERLGETYVDYMGGSLYPESLIRVHTDFLHHNILGNTHSINNSYVLAYLTSRHRY